MYLPNISEIGVIYHKEHKTPAAPEHLETQPLLLEVANKEELLILKID
jgi:hypothetical protein